jgi:hypothetical protein
VRKRAALFFVAGFALGFAIAFLFAWKPKAWDSCVDAGGSFVYGGGYCRGLP